MTTIEEKAKAYAEKHWVDYALSALNMPWTEVKGLIEGIYLAGAAEALASQWHDPKEELPEDGEWVIILAGEDGVQTAVWNETHQCWDDDEGDDIKYEKDIVTLWMPIPEPPVEGCDL